MSAAVSEVLMKTSSQRTRLPQLKAKKRMNSRIQRVTSPGVGGQRNPGSSSSGWRRPQGSSGPSGPSRRMETSLLSQGVIGWPLLVGGKGQLLAPGCGDGLRRGLASGASDAVAG